MKQVWKITSFLYCLFAAYGKEKGILPAFQWLGGCHHNILYYEYESRTITSVFKKRKEKENMKLQNSLLLISSVYQSRVKSILKYFEFIP